jgi:hypothetical protein
MIARSGQSVTLHVTTGRAKGPAAPAAEHLRRLAMDEFGVGLEIRAGDAGAPQADLFALCQPWDEVALRLLKEARVALSAERRLQALSRSPYGEQGFVAARVQTSSGDRLLLAGNTETGLRNALLTLADRLYRDADENLVADPFDGAHAPAFEARHIKTDAMNCGPFRSRLEYWDPGSAEGVRVFADWLASFRISDYDLLAFVRGWGTSYPSQRFPELVDPQHPNAALEFYPRLIERLHAWGIRVWASDIYLASGYSMEIGTAPEIQSPCAGSAKGHPFKAGEGAFHDILHAPQSVVCLAHPGAARFYADVVDDLLARYPDLDGLDFHIGHAFPNKICRCTRCKDLAGNREGVYRCFAQVYETATARRSGIRMKTAVKMFGDATRRLVEGWSEFPRLEFFCWLRWVGNLLIERTDAPVTTGHEDGGGGLEANHDPKKTLAQIRDYFRDYEPWIHTYVRIARRAGLASLSWEPALQRELEHLLFFYSQLTWEPELSWSELARRYVLRSERRCDERLIEAYRLALEANAAVTQWGLAPYEPGTAQRVIQTQGLLETTYVRERIAALGDALEDWLGAPRAVPVPSQGDRPKRRVSPPVAHEKPPVAFDLRRSLVKTWRRMQAGEVLGMWH